ncbi:DUF1853 family protein [Salinimicrobium catena]|uniref:DUF1853 family protein n=1 Tax=Salinimicrobium catena TaxID=390640 RepID=UPI002FE4A8AD
MMEKALLHQFSGFLNTPQIWEMAGPFPYSPFEVRNIDLQKMPVELHFPPTMVLGKRMERFFHFYVSHFSEEKIIAHNEQIIHEKRTLGELDFLLKNERSGKVSHVELVYKYYLYDPEIASEAERWTGPNHRDNLLLKLERLQQKQFPLLYREETRPLLKKLGITAEEVEQKICFKANFFLPWDHPSQRIDLPNDLVQGHWLRRKEFTPARFGRETFFSPRKPNWPILPQHNTHWLSYDDLQEQIMPLLEKEQSPLIWMKTGNEYRRFFLVWW